MRATIGLILALCFSATFADDYVRGYTRKDGTYVAPHRQTEPNQHRYDNYSSQGNSNPYTSKKGTEQNEYSTPPVFNRSNPAYTPPAYTPAPNPYSPTNPYRNR